MTECNPDVVELKRAIWYKGDMREMDLKEKLIVQRKQKGLSQVQLAETIHVTRQAVSRWEVGDAVPSIDNLKLLSELYGLPMEYFLNGSMEEPERPGVLTENEEQKRSTKRRYWKRWTAFVVIALVLLVVVLSEVAGEGGEESKILSVNEVEGREITTNREMDFDLEW